uniref:Polyadenylate-binding protein n=1 Tax=Vitis vinifera TaxID=29760 RepID=A5BE57_VITVI|nr:hypothetical protein VITISV_039630 [Vitis vinifera]
MAAMLVSPPPPPQLLHPPPPSPGFELHKAALYVGDLDPEVSEVELVDVFSGMGPLVSVRLCRDSLSGKSLCYAYVNFFYPSDASKALACLNHTKLMGKPMRIMWSHRDPLPRKTGLANLFVKNLDPSINSASLQDIFCKFGNILSCKVAEENGKSKCFGFVQFDSDDSATAALNALNDTMLDGKKLFVSKFVKKCERKEASEETKFTNVYVKNLGEDLTEDIIRDKFSEFGKVGTVVIMKDGNGKSRGFGFVNFESPDEAKKAVEALNGAMLGSKKLFVGRAQKKAERQELLKHEKEMVNCNIGKEKASNLYVKNLDASVDDDKLQEHFSSCGQITSAKVMRHDSGLSKGFGFVCFSTSEEAQKALTTLNGTLLHGRSLYIAMAQRKEDRQRIPMKQAQQGNTNNWGYQQNSRTFATSKVPTQGLNYASPSNQKLHFKKKGNNKSGSEEASSKGSVSEKHFIRAPAQSNVWGNSKEIIGHHLYPLVHSLQPELAGKITGMLLEMNNSDIIKLLDSPDSLAVQVEQAVQALKEAKAWRSTESSVALPVESASCLSY